MDEERILGDNVRTHYATDFGELGIDEALGHIDTIRVRVSVFKHDGDKPLDLSDYESAAATFQRFWKILMDKEAVIGGPRVSPISMREAISAVVPSAMADAILAMTGFKNVDFRYTPEQVLQGNAFFEAQPKNEE